MFEFIEAPFFTKTLDRYLDDDEYGKLQNHLIKHPESGKVVPGSGGVRKIRWAAEGRGKRGGFAHHLLPTVGPRAHLDAYDLRKERERKHSGTRLEINERGN